MEIPKIELLPLYLLEKVNLIELTSSSRRTGASIGFGTSDLRSGSFVPSIRGFDSIRPRGIMSIIIVVVVSLNGSKKGIHLEIKCI